MTINKDFIPFYDKAIIFIATGGLIGFAPVAPGTFGSLAALPLCLWLAYLKIPAVIVFTIGLILISVWIAHQAEQLVGTNDPKQVVIDEICGMVVAFIGVPFHPLSAMWGFILFRVFDILKPFPIRWVDSRMTGGWGIVMDDVVAGLFANAVLHFFRLY